MDSATKMVFGCKLLHVLWSCYGAQLDGFHSPFDNFHIHEHILMAKMLPSVMVKKELIIYHQWRRVMVFFFVFFE